MPVIRVTGDEDTYNSETIPTSIREGQTSIQIDSTPGTQAKAFLRMNLNANLPKNAIIVSCKYKFYIYSGLNELPATVNFYDCIQPEAIFNQLTWNEYKFGNNWTTPGGDKGNIRASTTISTFLKYYEIDLTAWAQASYIAENPMFLIGEISTTNQRKTWRSLEYTDPEYLPYYEIEYIINNRTARLGKFTLGKAILGKGIKTNEQREYLTVTEEEKVRMEIPLDEFIGMVETVNGDMLINLIDSFSISEEKSYLSDYMAGIYAKITVILDVTDADFCEIVLEGGHTISVNGTAARAFCYIKQSGQKFDHGINIQPGDAVMFTCPTNPIIEVGDIITYQIYNFEIIAIIDHEFDGNLIYRKAALRKIIGSTSAVSDMPQVGGITASENLKGKTVLTWDDISKVNYPELDHYEVWESTVGGSGSSNITAITPSQTQAIVTLDEAYSAGKYTVGGLVTIHDSDDNDGSYAVAAYLNSGGFGELLLTTPKELTADAPLGTLFNATKFYMRDETKSNGLSVKNIVPNTVYYYIVRAIDKYGGAGKFSVEVQTAVNQTAPATPTGVRNG